MIVLGIILIIVGFVGLYYSFNFDDLSDILLCILSLISIGLGMFFIGGGADNLNHKEKEIKNVEYYNIKSTIIIENNIPTDTIYTIYYKKK